MLVKNDVVITIQKFLQDFLELPGSSSHHGARWSQAGQGGEPIPLS